MKGKVLIGRNPLKSGHRCNEESMAVRYNTIEKESRNPLKSGHRCNGNIKSRQQ